jgi:hypothetical protein
MRDVLFHQADIDSQHMFERFTEQARRVIFFARYEASNYGSPYIETEHLLLGLLREDHSLADRLGKEHVVEPEIRAEIERRITRRERISTSVEMPLSDECKSILKYAVDAATKLGHRSVETKHLLLGILRLETSLAAQILISRSFKPEPIQEQIAKAPSAGYEAAATISAQLRLETFLAGLKRLNSEELIECFAKNAEFIDASGQRWNREELWKGFDALFAHYAKKNSSYIIETTLAETRELFVAAVLWKNALLASEERIWMHRMSAVLLIEAGEWKILLLQVTVVVPSSPSAKKTKPVSG